MKHITRRIGTVLIALFSVSVPAMAQADRPIPPADASSWAGATVIIICAMFLMAAVIGPAVRGEMVEQAPPHDDQGHGDHGHADHHAHGH